MIKSGNRISAPLDKVKKANKRLAGELTSLQQRARELSLPVIILFEGWEAAGKNSLISSLIDNFDPRGFIVHNIPPQVVAPRSPYLHQFWTKIPLYGQLAIFNRSWYHAPLIDMVTAKGEAGSLSDSKTAGESMENLKDFEAMLSDDGYVIVKLFVDISKKEQKKRLDDLAASDATSWRVTADDYERNRRYDEYLEAYNAMIAGTHTDICPWLIVDGHDREVAKFQIFSAISQALTDAIYKKEKGIARTPSDFCMPEATKFALREPAATLADCDFSLALSEEEYRERLKAAQKRLRELHYKLYHAKIPVIMLYEGHDAAGKGGNIKRVAGALDPRGYRVVPIAAPTSVELNHHYLWRFCEHMPTTGHIRIFDRTWYGRVLVERIEGFASGEQWRRAYNEINAYEKALCDWGAIVFKFWVNIDKDEQLRRFEARQNDPLKLWKITDEDWRNREKWDEYTEAIEDMFRLTDTVHAPWLIVPSNDKYYARILVLEHIIAVVEEHLKKGKGKAL